LSLFNPYKDTKKNEITGVFAILISLIEKSCSAQTTSKALKGRNPLT